MAGNKFPESMVNLWRSVQTFLNRMGIHPLAALLGVILLIIFPRFVIFGLIIYVVYWLYRNGVFSGRNNASGPGNPGAGAVVKADTADNLPLEEMNKEQRNALLTGILVLAVMLGAGMVLTAHPTIRSIVFIGLLLLAAVGCIVESHVNKQKKRHAPRTDPTDATMRKK